MTHEYGDERIVTWLDNHEYHPQSSKDGEKLCRFFAEDLAQVNDSIAEAYQTGELAFAIDHDIEYNELTWDVDLLIGRPAKSSQVDLGQFQSESSQKSYAAEGELETVWLAADAKAVMTAHRKARKNRARNVFSLAATLLELAQVDGVYPEVVDDIDTVGIALVNMAERFWNPDSEDTIKEHNDIRDDSDIRDAAERTFNLMEQTAESLQQIHSIGCIGLQHTNITEETLNHHPQENPDSESTVLDSDSPAPQKGESIHYRTFVESAAKTIENRL